MKVIGHVAVLGLLGIAAVGVPSGAFAFDGDVLLQTPAANAIVSTSTVVPFSWSASPYGDAPQRLPYTIHLQIGTDPSLASGSVVVDRQSTCYSPAACATSSRQGPFAAGVYYWRITSSYEACFSDLAARGALQSGAADFSAAKTSEIRSFTVSAPMPVPAPTPAVATTPPNPASSVPVLPPADVKVPLVRALGGTVGRLGRVVQLRFTVSDDSGKARVAVAVFRGTVLVWKRAYALQGWAPGRTYSAPWKATRTGKLRFCLVAADAAGNKSGLNCAPLAVVK